MEENKTPLHQAIFNDVLDEYQAKAGESYEEVKNAVTAEYERRVRDYLKTDALWQGDTTPEQRKNLEAFKKKYESRGKIPKKPIKI